MTMSVRIKTSLAARLCAGACLALAATTASVSAQSKAAKPPAAALPDWSGVWNPRERNLFDPSSLAAAQRQAGPNPLALFEASYMRMYPPYRPDYEARYAATLARTQAGAGSDPTAACLPPGFPRIMGTPYPLEFIVQPGQVTILFEAFGQTRRIFTDGRPHPGDLDPTYNGHSIGHWEGDTLVVDTVGLRGDTVFDVSGAPHSDAMHVVERIRRVGAGSIEDRILVEDPKALTRPWSVVRTYERHPDWQMAEYVCEENQRNPVRADGSTGFLGPH
ncbi:MAG: hypothetical protein JWO72_2436 [Caulobacteraceae bacterium]|nr:hypothetical protein [Caulobacteraceae bacterium]